MLFRLVLAFDWATGNVSSFGEIGDSNLDSRKQRANNYANHLTALFHARFAGSFLCSSLSLLCNYMLYLYIHTVVIIFRQWHFAQVLELNSGHVILEPSAPLPVGVLGTENANAFSHFGCNRWRRYSYYAIFFSFGTKYIQKSAYLTFLILFNVCCT